MNIHEYSFKKVKIYSKILLYIKMSDFNDGSRHQREIMIGDYADIIYANDNDIYRYYIIKIENDKIHIAEVTDPIKILILIKNSEGISWKIEGYDKAHEITFRKNATDTHYIERDFTQTSIRTTEIEYTLNEEYSDVEFTELKNGIILYLENNDSYNPDYLGFFDPNAPKDTAYFLTILIPKFNNRYRSYYKVIHFVNDNKDDNNEIFLFDYSANTLIKLNLDDLTFMVYDHMPTLESVFPLKNKKILYQLRGKPSANGDSVIAQKDLVIFDIITKEKIYVDNAVGNMEFPEEISQANNEDIILKYTTEVSDGIQTIDFYRVNVKDGSLKLMAKIDNSENMFILIAVLLNDNILLFNWDLGIIQIFDYVNQKISTIYTISDDLQKFEPPITTETLQNDDILFEIDSRVYLFNHETYEVTKIFSFEDDPESDLHYSDIQFKQLQNGNLLINNGQIFSIIEFPPAQQAIDRRSYDKIRINIKTLDLDMLEVIRGYL